MINCLIVDDEPLAREVLETYVKAVPFLHLVKTCTNALEAIEALQTNKIDLIFLDIQMPRLTGIQFLNTIKDPPKVIFTTAYSNYALDSYNYHAVDYLLKPFSFERFLQAVNKLKPEQAEAGLPVKTERTEKQEFLFIKSEYKIIKVSLKDILYVEGLKDYISVYTENQRILSLQSLRKMEESLPASDFIRVHKSYIVPIARIESIERNRILINQKYIPIGDTYRPQFYQKLKIDLS